MVKEDTWRVLILATCCHTIHKQGLLNQENIIIFRNPICYPIGISFVGVFNTGVDWYD